MMPRSSAGVYALLVLIFLVVFTGADGSGTTTAKLHFFIHDMVDLQNPANATTALVATPNGNLTAPETLGSVIVVDDKITTGPSPDSAEIGRARGVYMTDAVPGTPQANTGIFFTFAIVLENGTISVHGQDNFFQREREMAVIGGTGVYRSATGYVVISTNKMIPPFSAILDVQVFLRVPS